MGKITGFLEHGRVEEPHEAKEARKKHYREFILPHTRRIFETIAGRGVPTIHFGVGTGAILGELREAGGDVIGADWRTPGTS